MASFSDIARRQTRLRSRPLGKLEGSGFKDIVKEKSISKLARLKQKAQDANTKPKPEMPLEAAQQTPAMAPPPPQPPPVLEMPPAMPAHQPTAPPMPPPNVDAGPGIGGTDTTGMIGMADTAFGATPAGQVIGQGMANVAKGLLGKAVPFAPQVLEQAKPDLFSYQPTQKGWNARGQAEGLSGPVGTSAGGVGPPSAIGGGAAAGFGNASTPGSIGGGGHSPGGAALGAVGPPAGAAPPGTPGAVGGTMGSSAGGAGVGGGGVCIIISACTDPYSYEVDVTRAFRDIHLTDSMLRGYYALARKVVPFIQRFGVVRTMVKHLLVDRLIDYGEYIMDLKPARERRGSEAVSLGFLRLIGWIGRKRNG